MSIPRIFPEGPFRSISQWSPDPWDRVEVFIPGRDGDDELYVSVPGPDGPGVKVMPKKMADQLGIRYADETVTLVEYREGQEARRQAKAERAKVKKAQALPDWTRTIEREVLGVLLRRGTPNAVVLAEECAEVLRGIVNGIREQERDHLAQHLRVFVGQEGENRG